MSYDIPRQSVFVDGGVPVLKLNADTLIYFLSRLKRIILQHTEHTRDQLTTMLIGICGGRC